MPETSRCIRQGAAMAKQVVEACVNAGTCAAGASHYAALISALASIWSQVKHQLIATMNNDLIGGSVALAVASTLVGLAWRLWRWIRGVAHDRMFVSYEIPSGTPQYFAAPRHPRSACYSRVSGYVSAHLALVKNRSWQRVARVRIYTGKLTRG